MTSQYDSFFEMLASYESGTPGKPEENNLKNYLVRHSGGHLGKYALGEDVLNVTGYYKRNDTAGVNDWTGRWTGKDNVHSLNDFLRSASAQEKAVRVWARYIWGEIRKRDLHTYVGQTMGGVRITESGLIAAVHLKWFGQPASYYQSQDPRTWSQGALRAFLQSNGKIDGVDGKKTPISKYLRVMGGYQTPFDLDPKLDHVRAEFERYIRYGKKPSLNPDVSRAARELPTHYIWRSRDDQKVRPAHAANDDKIFALHGSPQPQGGHLPGTEHGCRCWAEWIIETRYPLDP